MHIIMSLITELYSYEQAETNLWEASRGFNPVPNMHVYYIILIYNII
jgi:hypothetical protein